MKIAVNDLEPNPFRQIERYPIDRAKVEALKTSIKETSFWDNILVRKRNGKYQIAYGHHRRIALIELGIKYVDIPVRDIDDATMVRIMAEENLNWSTSPMVINETVLAVKTFLDGELAESEWATLNKSIKSLFAESRGFENAKKQGVGQTTILKFLGKNWRQWMIQEALDTLRDESIDRGAVESLPTLSQGQAFKKAVRDYKIPKAKQKEIAEKIANKDVATIKIREVVHQEAAEKDNSIMVRLEGLVEDIDKQARALRNKLMVIRGEMDRLNVKQVKGIKVSLAKSSLHLLYKEMKRLEKKE